MASYTNIDPSSDRGQTFMDAGQIYFKEGTFVVKEKAMAFQNIGTYCVAPIVRQPIENPVAVSQLNISSKVAVPPSGTFDFWAVGKDCCDPSGGEFTCGEVANDRARAGIRMMRDDIRPFFVLAVQEWTAWVGAPSAHPLFFHWVEDPLSTLDSFYKKASTMFGQHVASFFFMNLVGTLLLLWLLYGAGIR
eukprot:CAMPEP_0170634786 /NCGR_PEP_ID=MMETSP0224-20130122/36828_1 /TAXON_ID=285029 /ORGANISM="Togula jolla, Strain CCCM 725" /LENGTH=190 /DNA_ID=CAMNT_0010964151 /DNA_START=417 /DNA_END=989 /DNA_ORIENTATION=+